VSNISTKTLRISTETRAPVTYHICVHDRPIFLYLTTYSRKFLSFITFAIQQILQIYDDSNQEFLILYSTMATSATMRAMFERLGFTPGAASSLEGNDHGINTLEEVVFLNDKDIYTLVKQLRRLGGMIAGPTIVGGAAQGAPGPLVANPGHSVSIRAETNIKLEVFYLRHQSRISRIVSPASIALPFVRRVRSTKEYEENFKVTAEQPIINEKDWPRTMEAIHEFFGSVLGETGVPLAYVVRENVEIPPGTDPLEGYITVAEEMIACAPHGNQAYANDSMEVWSYMVNITRAHECWTYVKPSQRTKDGRRAFLLLWNHFLGPNNVDNMA
jgi:hypothetical protein